MRHCGDVDIPEHQIFRVEFPVLANHVLLQNISDVDRVGWTIMVPDDGGLYLCAREEPGTPDICHVPREVHGLVSSTHNSARRRFLAADQLDAPRWPGGRYHRVDGRFPAGVAKVDS